MSIEVAISPGELVDKITILEIKNERIGDAAKRRNVAHELDLLCRVERAQLPDAAGMKKLRADLKSVNEALWAIEDDIRACEAAGDFGVRFVELARSVYRTNDRRAALKREINELCGSALVEEKSYQDY